jgi:hypothetical protein
MRANPAIETIRSLAPALVTAWLAGCLYTVDGDPQDGGQLGAGTMFLESTTFTEEGIDPPDSGDGEEPDAGAYDFGEYCAALVECVCDGLDTEEYALCLEAVAEMSEDDCEQLLQEAYPGCLP